MLENQTPTPNVLTEVSLKQRLKAGSTLTIKCRQSPTRKASVWYGLWTMEACHPDGTVQMLVTARSRLSGDISVREFKTVTGIVSFLMDCGFSKVSFPVIEGDSVSLPMNT